LFSGERAPGQCLFRENQRLIEAKNSLKAEEAFPGREISNRPMICQAANSGNICLQVLKKGARFRQKGKKSQGWVCLKANSLAQTLE